MGSNKIFSNLMWKFSERILAQGVTFVVTLCLARLLMPKDYGVVALALIVINIAEVFTVAGFGNALIQKKDADDLDFSSVFYFNIFFSVILYFLIFISAPLISGFFDNPELSKVIRVLAVRVPVAAVNSVQQAYVSRNMMFKRFFWSTFFGTILSGIIGIFMAFKGYGVWALVAQYLINAVVDTIVLWITVHWRPKLVYSFDRVKTMFSYGWKLMVAGVIDEACIEIRNIFIGKIYTTEDLAYYTNGNLYPQAITSGINTTISSVLFPTLSKEQDDAARVKSMTRRAVSISSYIMWPVMLGMAAVAPCFVKTVLSDKWLPCVPYIQIACITYGFWPIHTSNLEAMKSVGRSDWFLKLEIIKDILGITVLLCVVNKGVMAIAISAVFTSLICCFINAYPNWKLINYTYTEQIKDMLPSLIKSLIMGAAVYAINYIKLNGIIILCIQVIVGIMIYIGLSLITKDNNYHYLLNVIKKGRKKNE
ncbi:MAG: lipopolysaccharide biosynthesis protein [Lachnospiraceae bacterium]|nr:lipopolysaccharide biosynthesis protein [Lachnospiraceae bacterium]